MAINRFSKQRTFAKFTPESLEKMSIVPSVYSQLYNQRESAKAGMRSLGFEEGPMHQSEAAALQAEWTKKLNQEGAEFYKKGFADPNVNQRMTDLFEEYAALQKGPVSRINQHNKSYTEGKEFWQDVIENEETPGAREWANLQYAKWTKEALTTPLEDPKTGAPRTIMPPSHSPYRDHVNEIIDLLERADKLSTYGDLTTDVNPIISFVGTGNQNNLTGAYETRSQRLLEAGYALANTYVNDPAVQQHFLLMEELYGTDSGIVIKRKDDGTPELDANGNLQIETTFQEVENGKIVGFNDSTALGSALNAALLAKYGQSFNLKTLRGVKGTGSLGASMKPGDLPNVTLSSTIDASGQTKTTRSVLTGIVHEAEKFETQYEIAVETNNQSMDAFMGNVSENLGMPVDQIGYGYTTTLPAPAGKTTPENHRQMIKLIAAATNELKDSPKELYAKVLEITNNRLGEGNTAATIAGLLVDPSTGFQRQLLEINQGIQAQQEIEASMNHARTLQKSIVEKADGVWIPYKRPALSLDAMWADNITSASSALQYNKEIAQNFTDRLRYAAEHATDVTKVQESMRSEIFKNGIFPPNLSDLDSDFEKIRLGVESMIWSHDYTEGTFEQDDFVRAIERIDNELDYINLGNIYQTELGGLLGSTVGFFFEDIMYPIFTTGANKVKQDILNADLDKGRAGTFYSLSDNLQTIAKSVNQNIEAQGILTDQQAVLSSVVTVNDGPDTDVYNKWADGILSDMQSHLSSSGIANVRTAYGASFLQHLIDRDGLGLDEDTKVSIENTTLQFGYHTNLETGYPEPTLVLSGEIGIFDKSEDGQGKFIQAPLDPVHLSLEDFPVLDATRDRIDLTLWMSSNAKRGNEQDALVASFFNQRVGQEIISNSATVAYKFQNVPQKPETMVVELTPAGNEMLQRVSLPNIELSTFKNRDTGRWEWKVASNQENRSGGGAFELPTATSVMKLGALYEMIGSLMYDNLFQ